MFVLPLVWFISDVPAQATTPEKSEIESLISNSSGTVVTSAYLSECEITVVESYSQSEARKARIPRRKKWATETIWKLNLKTVGKVEISSIQGDNILKFEPHRDSILTRLLGRTNKIEYTEKIYYDNGDINKQPQYFNVGIVISEKDVLMLDRIMMNYINNNCK